MKKGLLLTGLFLLVVAVLVTGCGAPKTETAAPAATEAQAATEAGAESGAYTDGKYFAIQPTFNEKSGWKSYVLLEVSGGKIVTADWNGVSVNAGMTKKEASKAGFYPMVEKGGAKAAYEVQAAAMEAYLIEKQDVATITLGSDGKTDAVSGVSIAVGDFVELTQQALAAGPQVQGAYTDGAYHAEQKEFSAQSGWKDTVDLTVVNGNIVAVNWSGVHKDGGDTKKAASLAGAYGMVAKGGAKAEWHVQAADMENFLLEKQDITMVTLSDPAGYTDAVSSVSMNVSSFIQLVTEALK